MGSVIFHLFFIIIFFLTQLSKFLLSHFVSHIVPKELFELILCDVVAEEANSSFECELRTAWQTRQNWILLQVRLL